MTAPPLHNPSAYAGQRVAFLTQHGKERVIAPLLKSALGCHVVRVAGYDTDLLGTFTRDIPRVGTQLEAARRKARIGMQLTGWPLGLASEGSFGLDPQVGMFPWNVEFLIWIDDVRELEVVGVAQGKANFAHLLAKDWATAEAFAKKWEFPEHCMVVRPEREDDLRIRKGISSWTQLEAAFTWALEQSSSNLIFLEVDVRAHANPTRLENIRLAADDLVKKLRSVCPECGAPGFWIVECIAGLPCEECGTPTQEPRADVLGCAKCQHRITRERTDRNTADPGRCTYCNP